MVVVHGKDILMPFLLPVAEAGHGTGGGTRSVERFCKRSSALIERLIVARLVNANPPDDDGGPVAVAAHHVADVVDDNVLPMLVADISPAGRLLPDHQSEFVA